MSIGFVFLQTTSSVSFRQNPVLLEPSLRVHIYNCISSSRAILCDITVVFSDFDYFKNWLADRLNVLGSLGSPG